MVSQKLVSESMHKYCPYFCRTRGGTPLYWVFRHHSLNESRFIRLVQGSLTACCQLVSLRYADFVHGNYWRCQLWRCHASPSWCLTVGACFGCGIHQHWCHCGSQCSLNLHLDLTFEKVGVSGNWVCMLPSYPQIYIVKGSLEQDSELRSFKTIEIDHSWNSSNWFGQGILQWCSVKEYFSEGTVQLRSSSVKDEFPQGRVPSRKSSIKEGSCQGSVQPRKSAVKEECSEVAVSFFVAGAICCEIAL